MKKDKQRSLLQNLTKALSQNTHVQFNFPSKENTPEALASLEQTIQ